MSRIIAFGCSFTYGDGLQDCWSVEGYPGKTHSKLSWPNKLGLLLNIPVINAAASGASNKQIWNTVVNFKLQKNDIVIILWSHFERHCIIHKDNITKFSVWNNDKISKQYFKIVYDFFDLKNDFHLYSNHSKFYLDKLKIKNYHLSSSNKLLYKMPAWNSVAFLPIYMETIMSEFPTALDNAHPGEKAHMHFAEKLRSWIA